MKSASALLHGRVFTTVPTLSQAFVPSSPLLKLGALGAVQLSWLESMLAQVIDLSASAAEGRLCVNSGKCKWCLLGEECAYVRLDSLSAVVAMNLCALQSKLGGAKQGQPSRTTSN